MEFKMAVYARKLITFMLTSRASVLEVYKARGATSWRIRTMMPRHVSVQPLVQRQLVPAVRRKRFPLLRNMTRFPLLRNMTSFPLPRNMPLVPQLRLHIIAAGDLGKSDG